MSLRDEFEKLHLGGNPQLARRNSTDDSYVPPSINDAWAGFQAGHTLKCEEERKAGHAAGLERAAKLAYDFPSAKDGRIPIEIAAAIREMKEQKK
jgi:hypothetical protein